MPQLNHALPEGNIAKHTTLENLLVNKGPVLLQQLLEHHEHQQRVDESASQILEHIQRNIAPAPAQGIELYAQMRDYVRLLPVGCDPIDGLLRGGLREGQVTELCGESASGKSQICHSATVLTAIRGERVVYIDTTNCFSTVRVANLHGIQVAAGAAGPASSLVQVLANILVLNIHSIHELFSALDELSNQLAGAADTSTHPRLVVIDAISAILSPTLGSRQHHHGRALLSSLGMFIRSIARRFGCAMLVTNHMVSTGNSGSLKPALGEGWRSQVQWRLQLSNHGRVLRRATVLSSTLGEIGRSAGYELHDNGALLQPS